MSQFPPEFVAYVRIMWVRGFNAGMAVATFFAMIVYLVTSA